MISERADQNEDDHNGDEYNDDVHSAQVPANIGFQPERPLSRFVLYQTRLESPEPIRVLEQPRCEDRHPMPR